MRVLGIESSCDETAVGIVDTEHGVVGEALYSQAELHAPHGGVVPEIAARDHVRRLLPVLETALKPHCLDSIDAIAYTTGPGLASALLTGAIFGHGMAWALDLPAIGIHHLEAHLLSPMLDAPDLHPPYLALLVSGGHTQMLEVSAPGTYKLLGETLDDAAGEAFDKVARCLGLGYPGGAKIMHLAKSGQKGRFTLPRPMTRKPGLDFSFSGLKTETFRTIQNHRHDPQSRADIALAFQEAVFDSLMCKLERGLEKTGLKRLVVAGGVSANTDLRARLVALEKKGLHVFLPRENFCTDNGVMIAYAGLVRLSAGQAPDKWPQPRPRWPLDTLPPLAGQASSTKKYDPQSLSTSS